MRGILHFRQKSTAHSKHPWRRIFYNPPAMNTATPKRPKRRTTAAARLLRAVDKMVAAAKQAEAAQRELEREGRRDG